jgi:hypothetical protein
MEAEAEAEAEAEGTVLQTGKRWNGDERGADLSRDQGRLRCQQRCMVDTLCVRGSGAIVVIGAFVPFVSVSPFLRVIPFAP